MGRVDVPEILIGLGFAGMFALAVYNWVHRHAHLPK